MCQVEVDEANEVIGSADLLQLMQTVDPVDADQLIVAEVHEENMIHAQDSRLQHH